MNVKMYDLYKGNELIGTYTSAAISDMIGIRQCLVNLYADEERTFNEYSIRYACDFKDLLGDWDETRNKILNAPDKITKTMVKVPFTIWKRKPESKVNKYRKTLLSLDK